MRKANEKANLSEKKEDCQGSFREKTIFFLGTQLKKAIFSIKKHFTNIFFVIEQAKKIKIKE